MGSRCWINYIESYPTRTHSRGERRKEEEGKGEIHIKGFTRKPLSLLPRGWVHTEGRRPVTRSFFPTRLCTLMHASILSISQFTKGNA
jgi:hypothetical protein